MYRKYWDWHLAVSLFGTVFKELSCNSKSFAMLFGIMMSCYCPCVIIIIIIIIIRVSQTHIQGLCHIIQYFLQSIVAGTWWTYAVRIPVGERYVLFSRPPRNRLCGPPSLLFIRHWWAVAQSWPLNPSSAKLRNEWNYNSFPPNALKSRTGTSLLFYLPYCTSIPAHDMHSLVCLSVPIHSNA